MIAVVRREDAPACWLCGAADVRPFVAPEMMLGLGESFDYYECLGCGGLWIAGIPGDLGRFYPPEYYGFAGDSGDGGRSLPSWCLTMGNVLAAAVLGFASGRPVSRTELAQRAVAEYFAGLGVTASSRILDVGCGGGAFLRDLADLGFRRLTGIDPFLAEPREVAAGVRVERADLFAAEPGWDLVTLHHSFEHLADPAAALRRIAALLVPGGACLLRTPLVPCEAWTRFGPDWMQLDAPRHLFIHTVAGLRRLAAAAGLELRRVHYDAGFLSEIVSEQYQRGIAMLDPRSFVRDPTGSATPPGAIAASVQRARQLNAQARGDQAAFTLVRPPAGARGVA